MSDYSLSDIAAVSDGGGMGGRGGWGDGWWIILLFILLGGWGNRGYGGQGAGNVGGNELYPWMENQGNIFNGFATLTNAVTNGFANAETAATARQMADMQQMFGLSQQFAQCCCDNRLGLANLGADIAREACADRAAVSDGVRDILANQTASVQRILDQMCQDKIDAKNEEIANLRQQVNMMNLAASQNLQTAQLLADNAAQTNALEQYLAPVPRPAYVVQNPNCCQQWQGCGCN
ncbi:MAG: hypothetical protein IJ586_00030 [Alloprevotella sp.]|nr:hypothetical protein [Alloprevotella sp.]